MKPKIAFVCQRYGPEVNGGSEQYCRQVAEALSDRYDVTVYTTCAMDYITWANSYVAGESEIQGVKVQRYPVEKTRNRVVSALVARLIRMTRWNTLRATWKWIDLQGPYCPELIEALRREGTRYQAILFMTYLYYPTARGMELGLPHSILIPTVHDEPPARFRCYDQVFENAKGIVWNSPEEREYGYSRFPSIRTTKSVMAGIGIQKPAGPLPELPENLRGKRYLVYAGRIAESKGCDEMLSFFRKYKQTHPGELKLVLMGKAAMPIPEDPDILQLGFVSEEMKWAVMAGSVALALHSRFESLSMVALESMMSGRPILVSSHCEVLKGHCQRSGAGYSFSNYREYEAVVGKLLENSEQADEMGKKGIAYVTENYQWESILQKYEGIIQTVSHDGDCFFA